MNAFQKTAHLFRVGEWYDSKVPMLILPALYLLVLDKGVFSEKRCFAVLALLIFDSLFLAFGYLINDYADIETDKLAGKQKLLHQLSNRTALALLAGVVFLGCLPVLLFNHGLLALILLAVIYFFGASYSAPPLRFKERGTLGLLVSSTAQRCFPLLLLYPMLGSALTWHFAAWMLLSFFVGLRYILVHQYCDLENDRKSGVETFAMKNPDRVAGWIRLSFAAELVLLAWLMFPICIQLHWTIAFFVLYAVLAWIRWRGCRAVYGHGGLYSFDQLPLEDLYNNLLPLLFALLLTLQTVQWGILLALWLALLPSTLRHLKFPAVYLSRR